jgi:hypothetical protein
MKIAIVGSAPSSVGLAPYDDLSWEIWGCSSGAAPHARRVSSWFELHHYGPGDPRQYMLAPEYIKFLRDLKQPVYMIRHYDDIPSSVPYPKDAVQKEFGEYFFTSSIAWMAALAIQQKPTEIGFWGVDMAARDEYGYQRAGLHHFITLARMRGIAITVPVESDLLRSEPQYGCREPSPMAVKMMTRKKELEARLNGLQAQHDATFREMLFIRGALDDLDYWQTIWSDQDPKSIAGG